LLTGNGGLHGGIDSIAATPTNAAPLAIATALTSSVNCCAKNGVFIPPSILSKGNSKGK
jgi:hypothetical protein